MVKGRDINTKIIDSTIIKLEDRLIEVSLLETNHMCGRRIVPRARFVNKDNFFLIDKRQKELKNLKQVIKSDA